MIFSVFVVLRRGNQRTFLRHDTSRSPEFRNDKHYDAALPEDVNQLQQVEEGEIAAERAHVRLHPILERDLVPEARIDRADEAERDARHEEGASYGGGNDVSLVEDDPDRRGEDGGVEDDDDDEGDGRHGDANLVGLVDEARCELGHHVEAVDDDDAVVDAADLADELDDADVAVQGVDVAVLALVVERDGEKDGGGARENARRELHRDAVAFVHFVRVEDER